MAKKRNDGNKYAVRVSGTGNIGIAGTQNVVRSENQGMRLERGRAPTRALQELAQVLKAIDSPDRKKIDNALEEAHEEMAKTQPDKDEVGKALTRAIDYAKKASSFAGSIASLRPHLANLVEWLGRSWHHLLS